MVLTPVVSFSMFSAIAQRIPPSTTHPIICSHHSNHKAPKPPLMQSSMAPKNSLFAPFTISHPSETGVYYIDIHKTPSLFLNSLNSSFFLNFVNLHLVTPVSITSRLQLRQQLALQIVIVKVLALVLSDNPCSVVTFRAFISSRARRRKAGTLLIGVFAIWRAY